MQDKSLKKKKSQTVQVFTSSPAPLATVSSLLADIKGDWNTVGNEKSTIIDILRGSKWLCSLSWHQAGLVSRGSDLSLTDPRWFLVQPPNRPCALCSSALRSGRILLARAQRWPRADAVNSRGTVPELISLPRNRALSCSEWKNHGTKPALAGGAAAELLLALRPTVCGAIWCHRCDRLPGHPEGLCSCGTRLPPSSKPPEPAGD